MPISTLSAATPQTYRVTTAVEAFCSPDWYWDSNESPFGAFNLWMVRQGRGWLETRGRRFPLNPGDCFVLSSEDHQYATHDPSHPLVVPFVLFEPLDAAGKRLAPSAIPAPPLHNLLADPTFFYGLIRRLMRLHDRKALDSAAASVWLHAALNEYGRIPDGGEADEQEDEQRFRIDTLCRRLQAERRFTCRLDELAREACYCPDHLIRLFKKYKGVTPGEFMIQMRIEEARSQLRSSSLSLSRIAELLGYPSLFAFSRQFRLKTGQSPSSFRTWGDRRRNHD